MVEINVTVADSTHVHGLVRRSSSFNTERLDHLYRDPHEEQVKLLLHYADLQDSSRLVRPGKPIG